MPELPPTFRPRWAGGGDRKQQRQRYDQERGSSTKRGYGAKWQRIAKRVKQEEPLCRYCKREGRVRETQVIDHIIPVRIRPDLWDERSNLQGLCSTCHNSTKQAEERQRYGAMPARPRGRRGHKI